MVILLISMGKSMINLIMPSFCNKSKELGDNFGFHLKKREVFGLKVRICLKVRIYLKRNHSHAFREKNETLLLNKGLFNLP